MEINRLSLFCILLLGVAGGLYWATTKFPPNVRRIPTKVSAATTTQPGESPTPVGPTAPPADAPPANSETKTPAPTATEPNVQLRTPTEPAVPATPTAGQTP